MKRVKEVVKSMLTKLIKVNYVSSMYTFCVNYAGFKVDSMYVCNVYRNLRGKLN